MLQLLLIFLIFPVSARALEARDPSLEWVQKDLETIGKAASWPSDALTFSWSPANGPGNRVSILCTPRKIELKVSAKQGERSSTLYYGLEQLGFLFPHPRRQISPSWVQARHTCGKEFAWTPALPWRGFHLHTQHPSEWVQGFYMGQNAIADDLIRWLVHNRQNLLQIQLLRLPEEKWPDVKALLQEAQRAGLQVGVSGSFAVIQQKSYDILPLWRALTGLAGAKQIREGFDRLAKRMSFDFVTMELGTSEFTPLSFSKTLQWLNAGGAWASEHGKGFFTKIHVSTGQESKKWGNYNFLPHYADPSVGVLVHTVYFYGLNDEVAPMYGRPNFLPMRNFLLAEKGRRPDWYYPETSYFVALDIDLPLLLTPYLESRSQDLQFLQKNDIEGQLNFSTGQELGYWLMDWTVALGRGPLEGLRLLGEDLELWKKIIAFEREYFVRRQGIQSLIASNLMDEIPGIKPVHEHWIMRKLHNNPEQIERERLLLEEMRRVRPALDGIKDPELKAMLQVTWLRIDHSYFVRRGLQDPKFLDDAAAVREAAAKILRDFRGRFEHYPEAHLFEEFNNPTSYQWGYAFPAATLYFWKRDEDMVRHHRYDPFFEKIIEVTRILF